MSGVYQIYNPINNKRYIGSSIVKITEEEYKNKTKNRRY